MADELVDERQLLIDEMLDKLEHGKAGERRDAALYLGEAAAGEALDALVRAYHEDDDKRVRKAAAYALGMFRAVEKGLKDGRDKQVVGLLTRVEEEGKLGRRAPVGRWIRINLGLLLALALLVALFPFQDEIRDRLFPGSPRPRAEVAREFDSWYTLVRNDARALQAEFVRVVVNGGEFDCTAFFNEPEAYALPKDDARAYADLTRFVGEAEAVRAGLMTAKSRYNDACYGGSPLTREGAGEVYAAFVPSITALDALDGEINAITAPTAAPTAVPPSETPQLTDAPPTATVPAAAATTELESSTLEPSAAPTNAALNLMTHLPALYNLVDTVTGARGASSLLTRYWQDVEGGGRTEGCSITTPPDIPGNYVLAEAERQASAELATAVDLINSGLEALRNGWTTFRFACNSRDMSGSLEQGITIARTAADAFQASVPLLDSLRGG